MKPAIASVIICTYNRARLLRETLSALQTMEPLSDCEAEIVVVDNNSTDNTPQVVKESAEGGPIPIVYLKESQQGKSFALNLGLAHARGDIVALTDDDVIPAHDWLSRIVTDFRERDVTFVFGKVLPLWGRVPPPELLLPRARDIWGPLAIVDYGDTPLAYVPESTGQRLPIGANLALVKAALVTVGGWRTDLGKVNNSLISGEDHEIFTRLQRYGLYSGYYDPRVMVRHRVPARRLTRRYFREWFFWNGKTHALMLDGLYLHREMGQVPRIAGVPRFLYRQAFQQFCRWVRAAGRRDALKLLIEELRTLQYAGLLSECWRRQARNAMERLRRSRRESVDQPDLAR